MSRRWRIIIRSTVIGFIVIFTWIGVLVGLQWWQSGDSGPSFRAESEQVLALLNTDPEKVYDEASPALHDAMIKDRFLAIVSDLFATMGKFKQVKSIKHQTSISGPHGKTASAVAKLEFEKGTTAAELSYHYIDGKGWRLLGFQIQTPRSMQAVMTKPTRLLSKQEAPRAVHALVASILAGLRDGKAKEIYDAASDPFRESISEEAFLRGVDWRRQHMGQFVRVLTIITSSMGKSRKRAYVEAVLDYQNAKTRGTFHFIKVGEIWKLLSMKVLIPQPLAPTREAPGG